ncbi:peptidoglycan DD-metalloendopeptidase family protein, partial [Patescibacteria group bacterium]|nr:peptidoglycan DD-metalloendopeptidase family protein [Patescibacteria group bacterium]
LKRILFFLGKYILAIPIQKVGNFVFYFLIVRMYKVYLNIKSQLGSIYRPAKGKFLYSLTTRYVVHAIIILLTIIVTTSNLNAKELNTEVGQNNILATLIQPQSEELYMETSESTTEGNSVFTESTGSVVSAQTIGNDKIAFEESASITAEGAIVKPNLIATTIGDRVRESVIYHDVQPGETVSEIASLYKISTNTILWENELGARDFIKPGQQLTILPTSGISYQIKSGDTLEKIADKYGVTVDDIVEYNQLASAEAISKDQIILLDGGVPPAPPAPAIQPSSRFASVSDFFVPSSATPTYGTKLQWPTPSHRINQYYGWRHTGIDIDGTTASPNYAADTGRVIYSGWSGGYGLMVKVDHGNGMQTLYGHFSKIFVNVGDTVSRGQTLGMMGCTGWCTGNHLHFEVIVGGKKQNPLSYL